MPLNLKNQFKINVKTSSCSSCSSSINYSVNISSFCQFIENFYPLIYYRVLVKCQVIKLYVSSCSIHNFMHYSVAYITLKLTFYSFVIRVNKPLQKNVIWEHTALRTFWFFTISTLFPVMQMWLLNKNRRMAFCRNKIRFLAFTFYNSFSERNSPKVFNWIWKLSIWKWRFYFEKGLCVKFTKSSQI